MPNGNIHFASNVVFGIGLSYGALIYAPGLLPPAICGLIVGTLITPDYDLEVTTYTEKILKKVPVIGWIFMVGSYAYALLFKHRGSSHSWLIGTLSRIIWLFLFAALWAVIAAGIIFIFGSISDYAFSTSIVNDFYALIIQVISNLTFDYIINNSAAIMVFFAFWYLQDWNHYILDYFVSDAKRRRRKR